MPSKPLERPAFPPYPRLQDLMLPEHLSGEIIPADSSNRVRPFSNDISAVLAWLNNYRGITYQRYTSDIEHVIFWSVKERGKPFSTFTAEDIAAYEAFLANPQPRSDWIGIRVARDDPNWRPFAMPQNPDAIYRVHRLLRTCFKWLCRCGYIAGTPLWNELHYRRTSARTREAASQKLPMVEYLSHDLWLAITSYLASLPVDTEAMKRLAAQRRWVCVLVYHGGLRAAEIARGEMSSFSKRQDVVGHYQWFLATGSERQRREVALSQEFLEELKRYRISLGLSEYPYAGEPTLLVAPSRGKGSRMLTRNATARIVRAVLLGTAKYLRANGLPESQQLAAALEKATSVWLRYAAGSYTVNDRLDAHHVRDTFGHGEPDWNAGEAYFAAWHDSFSQKHRINWPSPSPEPNDAKTQWQPPKLRKRDKQN